MAQTLQTTDEKYLNQMRDLVLRETSNLDCTILLFGSRARIGQLDIERRNHQAR